MNYQNAAGCLAVAFWLGTAPALAQSLSLEQGFSAAWERTPEHRAATLWRDAAQASQSAAQRWAQGPVTWEVTARSDRFNRNAGSREYEIAAAVPLWLAGERSGTQSLAGAETAALDARAQATRWRLAAQVRDAYWAWQLAYVDSSLAKQRLDNAQQLAQDVRRRWQAGELARADSHQADGAVAQAHMQWALTEAEQTQALQAWQALTGSHEPPLPVHDAMHVPPPAVDTLTDNHPAVREQAAAVDIAQRQLALADVQVRANPELVLGTTRERGMRGERSEASVFVSVRLALGRLPDSNARRMQASAEVLQAQTRLAQEEAAVRERVQSAARQWQALQQAHAAAQKRAALAREVRGFVEQSFALGETDVPARLRVEQEAAEAEREAARVRVQLLAAASQWQQALGQLPQ